MTDYRVNLDVFAGPLDLLLYLVRKEEVDIYDIPIAKVTEQYIKYVEILKQLDIDVAGDFLVMAATLMEIKSAMLLPRVQPEEMGEEEAGGDPRTELIRQLLEYKKYKDAANLLQAAAEEHKERLGRPASLIDRLAPKAEPEVDMDQVSVWDLLEAFDAVCKATGTHTYNGHIQDDTPIDLYQIELLHRLQSEGALTFERVFDSRSNRLVMVGLFLALLELIRDKLVWAEQSESAPQQIYLRALTDEPAEVAVQRAILAVDETEPEPESEPEPPVEAAEAAQTPPIPIAEVPPKPQSPTGDRESEQTREAAQTPPIPIAELPPKPKSPANDSESEETHEAAATDGDLMFDKS
ncbi:MAG: segregation/condensation protein A [Sedimentisphaerales bacterium]|nr:segregation/condensation protein A [Sedimentisphaerales bacterium]